MERLSQFHNSAAFITDMNALQHSNFCSDRLLANDRMTKPVAHKEELFHELIPEPNSTTATHKAAEFPPEFARLMDQEITLDNGALRRLWQEAHSILPDATGEEIRHFFHDRARAVYRNRKLDNPMGLMLSSICDWFSPRRVLDRRKELHDDTEQAYALQAHLDEQLAELRSFGASGLANRKKPR